MAVGDFETVKLRGSRGDTDGDMREENGWILLHYVLLGIQWLR